MRAAQPNLAGLCPLFKESFARRRRSQLAVSVPVVVLMFALAFTQDRAGGTLLGLRIAVAAPTLFVAIAAALAFSFRNWRCPACNQYLGRAFNPKYCQSCGVELRV